MLCAQWPALLLEEVGENLDVILEILLQSLNQKITGFFFILIKLLHFDGCLSTGCLGHWSEFSLGALVGLSTLVCPF